MVKTQVVNVDGVGSFEVSQRTVRQALAISAEYNRLTEGAEMVAPDFQAVCDMMSYLVVMVVKAPDDWGDVYLMDPDDEEAMLKVRAVYSALRAAEARFRYPAGGDAKKPSEGVQPDGGVAVQAQVSADGE